MTVNEYQNTIKELLEHKLNLETACEWRSQMSTNIYAPILDVAVGPFSIEDGSNLHHEYDHHYDNNEHFIYQLVKIHLLNTKGITADSSVEEIEEQIHEKMFQMRYLNLNSRCFVAIEIENEVSRKHLMGGAVNASVLGRIAIAVGFTEEKHRAFLNLYRYFGYLQSVEKPTLKTDNLLIISADQLLNGLHEL